MGLKEDELPTAQELKEEEIPEIPAIGQSSEPMSFEEAGDSSGDEDIGGLDFDMPSRFSAVCFKAMSDGFRNFWKQVIDSNPTEWIYLAAVGVLSAFIGYANERVVMFLQRVRSMASSSGNSVADYAVWVVLSYLFILISAAITQLVQQNAAGSGIPEMKSILGGMVMSRYLTLRTLLAKFAGLVFVLGGSLPVGKEGPFVHMAAIIATQTANLSPFRYISQNPFLLRQMQSVAVAVGVSTCFGAPIGGVLFSIEVTSTIFNVSNLWKCFYGSAWSIVIFRILHEIAKVQRIDHTDLNETRFGPVLFLFVLLGIFCGCISALFLCLFLSWQRLIKRFRLQDQWRRYILISIAALSIGIVTYPMKSLRVPDKTVSNDMFDYAELEEDHWKWSSPIVTLPIYVGCKLVFASLAICLPVPAGCLTPVFAAGAVLGRWFGECLHGMDPNSIEPGIFAIVGAAALCSGVTRSLSVTIIVFEVTGELHNLVGVLLASLFAYSVSGAFYRLSIYDLILRGGGLPHLPKINSEARVAAELMQVDIGYLHATSTYRDLEESLCTFGYTDFPIVDQETRPKLIGTIPRHIIYQCITRHIDNFIRIHGFSKLPREAQERYNQYQKEGAPGAGDTTKAHMMAWWEEVYGNMITNVESTPRTLPGAPSSIVSPRQPATPLFPAQRETKLMKVLRNRGYGGSDEKKLSRNTSMILNTAKSCDEHHRAFLRTVSPEDQLKARSPHRKRRNSVLSSGGSTETREVEPAELFQEWMGKSINFTRFETMAIDHGPFMIMDETPAQRVGFLMSLLGLSQVFVVNRGNLLGVICKDDLFKQQQQQQQQEANDLSRGR